MTHSVEATFTLELALLLSERLSVGRRRRRLLRGWGEVKMADDLEEVCELCGKVLSKKARANLLGEQVVCTACYNREMGRRDRERRKAEEAAEREAERQQALEAERTAPPTPSQIAYAESLGVQIPAGATKWDVSHLISAAKAAQEANAILGQEMAAAVASQPTRPRAKSNLVWYGDMHCRECGYRWRARRNTPPAKCANCGSRNVATVRVPKKSGVGCSMVLMVAFVILVILVVIGMVGEIGVAEMIEIKAGFFSVAVQNATIAELEAACKFHSGTTRPDISLNRENKKFVLCDSEWHVESKTFSATMRRVRDTNLPAGWNNGQASPLKTDIAEGTSFSYSPQLSQVIVQYNQLGPRHSLIAPFFEAIGLPTPVIVHPKLNSDAMERLKHGSTIGRFQYSLGDITDKEALRGAGVGGTLDQLEAVHGVSIKVSITLRRTRKDRKTSADMAKQVIQKLANVAGVRSLQARYKQTDMHKMETLNLLASHRAVVLQISEKGKELDHADCRTRLRLALTQQKE